LADQLKQSIRSHRRTVPLGCLKLRGLSIRITNHRILRHQLGFLRISLTGEYPDPHAMLVEAPMISLEDPLNQMRIFKDY